MAGKKKEVILQVAIKDEEQWEEMLDKKGLIVVDVYQKWCGPCKAVVRLLSKIKNELADDLLHFATAEADSISALENYCGRCKPTFLFFAGRELVGVLRGANAPVLQKMIVEELAKEKNTLEQGGERTVVEDDFALGDDEILLGDLSQESEGACKPYTVAIVKPNAVAHGKKDEILMKVQDAGFQILAHQRRTLTEAEARDLYQHKASENFFEDLVGFMSGGPSHVLVLSHADSSVNALAAWRELMGPPEVEEAIREKPDSLRAQYGLESVFNAVHGSEDPNQASRELGFFFPNFRMASLMEQNAEEERVERTLALIRPGISKESRDEILGQIQKTGFTITLQKEITLTEEQVQEFYKQHAEEESFPILVQSMTSGPSTVMILTKKDAVKLWKKMVGPYEVVKAKADDPGSLGAQFCVENEPFNQFHGSETSEESEQEIGFFFPKQQTLAVIKPDAVERHSEKILEEIKARGFTITQQKLVTLSQNLAEEFYAEQKDKPFFNHLVEFMSQGPSLVLVLTKENAVEEWRSMIGPTDPEKAQEVASESLRARYGSDVLQNIVHGSSTELHAEKNIKLIFGNGTEAS